MNVVVKTTIVLALDELTSVQFAQMKIGVETGKEGWFL